MDHPDHVALIKKGVSQPGGVWADLGAGRGAFTLALAELLGPTGVIYAVDKNGRSLQQLQQTVRRRFPGVTIYTQQANFTQALSFLPPLDGILMANALHFLRHKASTLKLVKGYLKPNGRFLLVEYNVSRGNPWVPHPLAYAEWEVLAQRVGFNETRLLATRPSSFLREFYAAMSR